MKHSFRMPVRTGVSVGLVVLIAVFAAAQEKSAKASAPVLVTSCGQSPGPLKLTVFLKKLQIDHDYNPMATARDLSSKKFKTLVIVAGASLKGMGAAGVAMNDELTRTEGLIAEARKLGIMVIGAHVEGMARRAQGAAPGDNSDEQSIDAVCPKAQLLIVRKDGDADGRFTAIAKSKNIPLLLFEKNLDLSDVLKNLFGK
jgi:hypothetical protein